MFEKRQQLVGHRIAVLAADGFEQVEVTHPVNALEQHGAEVEIVSLRPGSIRGMNLLYPGKKIDVDRTVFTADARHDDGRRLTSWPGIRDDVRNAGGDWVDAAVVHDGNWVSSRGPQDLRAFDKAIVKHFAEHAGASDRDGVGVGHDGTWGSLVAGGLAAATIGYAARQALRAR
jgi:protease I